MEKNPLFMAFNLDLSIGRISTFIYREIWFWKRNLVFENFKGRLVPHVDIDNK